MIQRLLYYKGINGGNTMTHQPQTQPIAPVEPQPTNGLAIAALVVGIVAVISGWVPFWGLLVGATAVVLGIIGLKKSTGKGMAVAGIVTGAIGALCGIFVIIFFIAALSFGFSSTNNFNDIMEEENQSSQMLIDSKKDFAKGEVAKFGDAFEVKVNSVEQGYIPGQSYTAQDGKQYIKVNVTVTNISDEPQYISAYSFSVLENGMTQTSSYAPVEKELNEGDLNIGASTTGNVIYEVSNEATDLKLQYDMTVFDGNYKSRQLVYTLAL